MKKAMPYVLVAVVAVIAGVLVTYVYMSNSLNEGNTEINKQDNSSNSETIKDSIKTKSFEEVKSELYIMIPSTYDSSVYAQNKVTNSMLSDEQKILGALKYILLNSISEIQNASDLPDLGYYVSLSTINKYIKQLYNSTVTEDSSLPEVISQKNAQVTLASKEQVNGEYVYLFSLEDYGSDSTPNVLVNEYSKLNKEIKYDSNEVSGDTVIVYDKVILNNTIDWANTGLGTIKKFDGSSEVEVTDTSLNGEVEKYYEKYKEYFTDYKHTFKINSDGTFSYVSTEPVL